MKKVFLFVLGMMLLTVGFTGCKYSKPLDGPGMVLDSADIAALDSMNVSELTFANMAGIYDDEGQERPNI